MKNEKTKWKQKTVNYDDMRKEDDLEEKTNAIVTLVQAEDIDIITKYLS